MQHAKVFISHAGCDGSIALALKTALCGRGFEAWAYERDLPFGENLADVIRDRIRDCDHFMVVLSDRARESMWVQRELGLALALRERRGFKCPSIIGVGTANRPANLLFEARDFDTPMQQRRTIDFAQSRYFRAADPAELDDLADQLRPRVSIISEPDGDHAALMREAFHCYRELFPDPGERDDPADIETWLNESRRAAFTGSPWREILAVLHLGELVIGFAFLSVHVERHWCFGNYLGVRAGWRQGGRAELLLHHVRRRLSQLDEQLAGIVFEVEPVDFEALEHTAGSSAKDTKLDDATAANLRRARRILLYQGFGAMALLRSDGRPHRYVQPAMCEPLGREGERELILMVLPSTTAARGVPEAPELLRFLYDDLYGDAYGGAGGVTIDGFPAYLESVRRPIEQGLAQGWKFGKVCVPTAVRRLLYAATAPNSAAIAL